jgi:7-cyano-7-deazaguanine synthase
MTTPRPAIVLLSGGLDSATCLAIAGHEGFKPLYSMGFDYGQRHRRELSAAERIAREWGVTEHRLITLDLRQFGNSALTDRSLEVPTDQRPGPPSPPAAEREPLPLTYVPARNTIFLSYALAWAEVLDCDDVFIGVNAVDYSGYPDCRPAFIESFQQTARLGTRRTRFTVRAPLAQLSKAQIIRRGLELGVDYRMTHSCYDPDSLGRACGRCDSCLFRRKGFTEAGVPDPTVYAPPSS